ncbi:unnamed protein product [Rotaria magnacalcarata]|uniref:Uncharacterized protein n=1 Tax=Rotaria magnacalcarata TaxID=392030 RepID=A0A816X4F9_9BILA|nr:unnamed protein product [Rotaria magnacalcarata]
MTAADFWSQGRVLVVGDSRVRRLCGTPDPVLATNVDYAFEGGVLIHDLVTLVDNNIEDHHNIVIIVGFIGDETERYLHKISDEETVTLIRSKECNPCDHIIETVQSAHASWVALKPGRMILWSLPYYVDFATHNSGKMGECDMGDVLAISHDSSYRFVQFITRLKLQWVTSLPDIPFCQLNRVLFAGKNFRSLFNSFGAVSGENYRFPTRLLTDGLHPSAQLVREMWKFFHVTVSDLHDKLSGRTLVTLPPSETSANKLAIPAKPKKVYVKSGGSEKRKFKGNNNPYVYKKINLFPQKAAVHTRLSDHRDEDLGEEIIEEEPVEYFENRSWKAPQKPSTSSSYHSAPLGNVLPGPTQWSWGYHKRMVAETKLAVYTKGVQEQAWAEGRLATIIREKGLRAAKEGDLETVNIASKKWMEKLHNKMNAPHPQAKLLQDDINALLPIETDGDSSSSSDSNV